MRAAGTNLGGTPMWLELDGDGALYQQAVRALRAAILDGRLRAGARLPATRTLAREASLSRNTVIQAYAQLLDEGYLVSRQGSGTYVSEILPEERPGAGAAPRAREPQRARRRRSPPVSAQARRIVARAPRAGV
ncbi:MAG: winged helix-turn-helix domain-containing protein, partial [Myxococcota bacterium]|nr:winged helix-turn-helix domain-containing protein [Myxococcota bacterium]